MYCRKQFFIQHLLKKAKLPQAQFLGTLLLNILFQSCLTRAITEEISNESNNLLNLYSNISEWDLWAFANQFCRYGLILSTYKISSRILRLPCGSKFADFSIIKFGMVLRENVISEITGATDIECMVRCVKHPQCKSYNMNRNQKICQLNRKALGETGVSLSSMPDWLYKATDNNDTLVGQTCRSIRPCEDNSLCMDICEPPYYQCFTCEQHYHGLDCENKTVGNSCISNPCKNGGNCTRMLDGYLCSCPAGYTGTNCETEIDECDSLPCFNGGGCTDKINGFSCTCRNLTEGEQCERLVVHSCKEVYEKVATVSGNFNITGGQHHCVMNPAPICSGGWTLAMTLNGRSDDYNVASDKWTDGKTYNVQDGLELPLENQAKYPAAIDANFSSICVGMKKSGVTKWLRIDITASSLHELFVQGTHIPTELGRTAWIELSQGAYLQNNCNREGINVKGDNNRLYFRIGILGNNENDCRTPDSLIGLGGNYACGSRTDREFICFILVQ